MDLDVGRRQPTDARMRTATDLVASEIVRWRTLIETAKIPKI
jgi:hypothetical protein